MTSKAQRKRPGCLYVADVHMMDEWRNDTKKNRGSQLLLQLLLMLMSSELIFLLRRFEFMYTGLNKHHQRIYNQPFSIKLASSLPLLTRNFKYLLRRLKRILI